MSLFDRDIIEKDIPIFKDNTILGNQLNFRGILPEDMDTSNFIVINELFFCDPSNGNIYIKNCIKVDEEVC